MPWWGWSLIGLAVWLYLGLVAWRWDRYAPLGGEPLLIGCLLLWFLVLFAADRRPRSPWLPWEPKPDSSARRTAAEARSLALEREVGLEFDGVFLKPGYGGLTMPDHPLSESNYSVGDRVIVKSGNAHGAHGVVVLKGVRRGGVEKGWTVAVRIDKEPRAPVQGTLLFDPAELERES